MNKRNLLLALVAALAVLPACGDGGGNNTNTDACTNCGAAYEASFVVSKMVIGTESQGFNLDDEITQCTGGETHCIEDPTNGVDNRLSAILDGVKDVAGQDFDANTSIKETIDDGTMLVLFRLTDVNLDPMESLTGKDPAVNLLGYIGADADNPADATDNFSGSEPIDVNSQSLRTPTSIDDTLIKFINCIIEKGKLKCGPSTFNLSLTIQGKALSLEIKEAQITASIDVSPTKGADGKYTGGSLKEGLLGGYVPILYLQNTLNSFAEELAEQQIDPALIQDIMAQHADIDATPDGTTTVACPNGKDDCLSWQECRTGFCYEPIGWFDAISLAVAFEAKSFVFTGTIVTPPTD